MHESLTSLVPAPEPVTVTGFLASQRIGKSISFITLREGLNTLQCVYSKNLPSYLSFTKITPESFINVKGVVKEATVNSCSIKNIEILVQDIIVITEAQELPFLMKDNEATYKQREKNNEDEKNMKSEKKDKEKHKTNTSDKVTKNLENLSLQNVKQQAIVNYSKCLDNRSLDLRSKHAQSIFRIMDGAMFFFRDFLRKNNFIEIKTSKLIGASSEGGANLFEVKYFKEKAYLAQSPQLYKQMALLGGFKRVYEIGHVYRAEESNINRYLSEFVGVDLEMEIFESYEELIEFIYKMFVYVFDSLKREYSREIENVREYMPFLDIKYEEKPLILSFERCCEILSEINIKVDGDFNRENEKILGRIVKEKYDVDFFVIKDYPLNVRAFYTKGNEKNIYSYSYDFILRGEEILSGAERINEYEKLVKCVEERGIEKESIKGYLDAFKYGAPRHGGCGIGFERLMKALFDFKDIRYFNMFPREPTRLYP